MARPRIFDPSDRRSINIYLKTDQLEYLKKWAHDEKVSPSHLVRRWIRDSSYERTMKNVH